MRNACGKSILLQQSGLSIFEIGIEIGVCLHSVPQERNEKD